MQKSFFELDNAPVQPTASSLAPPIISNVGGKELWRLEQDYACPHDGVTITVHAGFEFDLASVPRLFWPIISPFDLSIAAPLIHDFLYVHAGNPPDGAVVPDRTFTRKETDVIFRDIMKKEGVWWWRRFLAFWAVRFFGGAGWGRAI